MRLRLWRYRSYLQCVTALLDLCVGFWADFCYVILSAIRFCRTRRRAKKNDKKNIAFGN